jgi:hypothetical protein
VRQVWKFALPLADRVRIPMPAGAERFTPITCPLCGSTLDATGPVDALAGYEMTEVPDAGGPSLCFRCEGIAIFTGVGMELRAPTEAELITFTLDPEVMAGRRLLRRFKATHPDL